MVGNVKQVGEKSHTTGQAVGKMGGYRNFVATKLIIPMKVALHQFW